MLNTKTHMIKGEIEMSEFDYNDQSVNYGEAPKTPTMGVVALVLSIVAIFV